MAELQTTEYVDLAGIQNLYVAKVTQNSATTYEAETPREMAGVATLKKSVESTSEKVYYSNRTAYTVTTTADPVLELEVSALDNETLSYILGQNYDTTRGALLGGDIEPTQCALMYEYGKVNGDRVFCVYYVGSFSYPETEVQTKTDSAVHNGMTLTYTSSKTQKAFTNGGRVAFMEVDVPGGDIADAKVDLSSFYKAVMTPDVTVKATDTE